MPTLADKVDHVVVLMLENRSFDHMLGFLSHPDPSFCGLSGDESNPDHPRRPGGRRYWVQRVDEPEVVQRDPGHRFGDAMKQLYGRPRAWKRAKDQTPTVDGFAWVHDKRTVGIDEAGDVLKCFAPRRVPVLSTLALEYAVCDMWFSPIPGATWPNRLFCHAATSAGTVDNVVGFYKLPTIFHALGRAGKTWSTYHDGISQVGSFVGLERQGRPRFDTVADFEAQAAAGSLPNYAFVEPDYFWPGKNDQHPVQDVAHGEKLIARIYDAVRSGPAWSRTLLVITYDEHGGFFDHVPPPSTVTPDDWRSHDFASFNFTRLGPRVPAVLVSPWIPRHTVDHSIYDHTAIIKSLRRRFGMPDPLTRRDDWSADFWHLLRLDAPRDDSVVVAPLEPTRSDDDRLDGLQDEVIGLAQQFQADRGMEATARARAWLAEKPDGTIFSHSIRRRRFQTSSEARTFVASVSAGDD